MPGVRTDDCFFSPIAGVGVQRIVSREATWVPENTFQRLLGFHGLFAGRRRNATTPQIRAGGSPDSGHFAGWEMDGDLRIERRIYLGLPDRNTAASPGRASPGSFDSMLLTVRCAFDRRRRRRDPCVGRGIGGGIAFV